MALSFWVGMGTARVGWRLIIGLAGSTYIAFWAIIAAMIHQQLHGPPIPPKTIENYITAAASILTPCHIGIMLFGGMFMFMRRRWTLITMAASDEATRATKLQFAVLHLLVVMSAVAVVLTLLRAARTDNRANPSPQTWPIVAAYLLAFGSYFVNTACAAHATLRSGAVLRNIVLVLLVASLLGMAISIASGHDQFGWWLVAGGALISVIPTMIVVLSLLGVRSCGFRLIAKQKPAPPASAEPQRIAGQEY
jgi:hypothetical protein